MRRERGRMIRPVAGLLGMALVMAASPAQAATPINGPAPIQINAPGSYVLTGNLDALGGDGIVINASQVLLDLNGFTITNASTGTAACVRVSPNLSSIIIRNGNLTQSVTGVRLGTGFSRGLVERLNITSVVNGIRDDGTNAINTRETLVRNNRIQGVEQYGIILTGDDNTACLNSITRAGRAGFFLYGNRFELICNEISNGLAPIGTGIFAVGVDSSRFYYNRCLNNPLGGMLFQTASDGDDSDNNILWRNRCNGNAVVGIFFDANSDANRAESNVVFGSGVDLWDDAAAFPVCPNTWANNLFVTDNEAGAAAGPGAGCVQ